jgi:hypothetical protein
MISPIDFVFALLIIIAALLMFATYKLGRRFASKEERERLKDWG